MTSQSSGRTAAIFVSAVFLASLAAATVAAPASAAKPTCFGKPATIVGTAKGEVIKGTKKADVIVARGGHDIVYGRGGNDIVCGNSGNDRIYLGPGSDLALGGTGNDRLFGNAGPDRLLGGPGNDAFNGGIGVDLCAQGTGSGPRASCERPPMPVPAPAPPSPRVLAIAYSNLDGNPGFGLGDVMISQLVDANGDGVPSTGDTIGMDRYPVDFAATVFGDWGVDHHVITSINYAIEASVLVRTATGVHEWVAEPGQYAHYMEDVGNSTSLLVDQVNSTKADAILLDSGSPSRPATLPPNTGVDANDNRFIDVVLNYPVP